MALKAIRGVATRIVSKANDLGMWLTMGALGGGVATLIGLALFAYFASAVWNGVM